MQNQIALVEDGPGSYRRRRAVSFPGVSRLESKALRTDGLARTENRPPRIRFSLYRESSQKRAATDLVAMDSVLISQSDFRNSAQQNLKDVGKYTSPIMLPPPDCSITARKQSCSRPDVGTPGVGLRIRPVCSRGGGHSFRNRGPSIAVPGGHVPGSQRIEVRGHWDPSFVRER
jgi:hypothetical protein